jgi:hypothetical protein
MTSAGIFITAIIIGFEFILFACLKGFPVAGEFYLVRANVSARVYPEKISEGE